ncbi:MAG: outer membrane beta-barrel protein [Bacteroidales bacterium]|jgi:opacity protein-like surface antigen|nr:outer membrane beta-barrel protein [Bacteroidales bacterium]
MKKIIIIILAVVLAAPLFSQVQFGLKAGVSTDFTFTSLDLSQASVDVVLEKAKSAEWGFQGGAFMRASFAGLYIQPELLLATATNSLTYSGVVDGQPVDELLEQKFTKVNIPVLVGFKLAFLRVNAGPAASILINDPGELVDGATYKKATFGYQAGLGLDLFKKMTIDLRYEGNLNQFGDEITIGGQNFVLDDRTGSLLVQVGIIF